MGKRVHVAKRYEVEWSNTGAFNWAHDKFDNLLSSLNCTVYNMDGDDDFTSDNFECQAEEYDNAIANLKQYAEDSAKLNEDLDADHIRSCLKALEKTAEEILEIMQSFRKQADARDGWIRFSAF